MEGKVSAVFVNKYERNQQARLTCIEHYGTTCQACTFDFGKVYGEEAKGYIHVHHITPLNEIGEEYTLDPIKDLIPLCPNCQYI
jgi:5-methylcytosine-specific restriction enzyme A